MSFRRLLLMFLFPLSILLIHTQFLILDQDFYQKEFFKHNVYETFSQSPEELDREVSEIIGFLKNKNELSPDFLQEDEITHLEDVKNLIKMQRVGTYLIILLTLTLFIWNWHDKKSIVFICLGSLILLALSIVLINFQFDDIFTIFHEVSFNNNLWMFDPQTSNLINVFPQEFFYDIVVEIFKRSVITTFILFVLILGYAWFCSRAKQKIYKNQENTKDTW